MNVKFKKLFIIFSMIAIMFLLNITSYAEFDEAYVEDSIIQQDTINVSCYDADTQTVEVKEYDFSSTPKVYPEENREPIEEVARPFWIVGPDDREMLTQMTTYPNRALCFIYVQTYGSEPERIGTGVMIGRNTVLTSAHVLYNADKTDCPEYQKWGAEVTVIPACWGGYAPNPTNKPYGSVMMEKMWVPEDYQTSGNNNYDWGIIKLREDKGNVTGFCDIESNDTSSELKNVEVVSKGYPNPNGTRVITPYKASGKILNAYGMRFYTDMDIEARTKRFTSFSKGQRNGCYWYCIR